MSTHIKHLLHACFDQNNWQTTLLREWPQIMGTLSSKVTIEKIEANVLTLGVTDSCWLQELYMLSPLLQQTINKTLDQPRIKKIRFKHARTVQLHKKSSFDGSSCKVRTITLTSAEQYALKQIKNDELRKAIEAFCIRCHRERS